jgi:hypothetical protein
MLARASESRYPHMCLRDAGVVWFLPVLYVETTMCTSANRRYTTNTFR